MNRVVLSKDDVKMLFEWCENNRDLVRNLPCPLASVEISFSHHNWRIKGIRQEKWLKLYISNGNQSHGKIEFEIIGRLLALRKGKTDLNRESFNSMLTCYCALMAFMVYEKPELIEDEGSPTANKVHKRYRGHKARKRTTYVLRRRKITVGKGGHHASPKGTFSVRGHFRRYRSGKVVWIAEYQKGTGKKKTKIYKIGQNKKEAAEIERAQT